LKKGVRGVLVEGKILHFITRRQRKIMNHFVVKL